MGLNLNEIKSSGTDSGPAQDAIKPGAYPCRIVEIIDRGVQDQRPHEGKEKAPRPEVRITYELLDEFCVNEDGEEDETKPRWISETFPVFSLTADRAKSTIRYLALDPEQEFGGDLTKLLGVACTVTIVQNAGKGKNKDKVYNNVQGVSAMRERDAKKAPDLVNPTKLFLLDDPDMEVFNKLPEWLQIEIKDNHEFDGSPLDVALSVVTKEEAEEEEDEGWED